MAIRTVLRRLAVAAAWSWAFSITLGLLFASCAARPELPCSIATLRLPAVVPVALFYSTCAALLVTPLSAWTVRTGTRNLVVYGPVLWLILAAYLVLILPMAPGTGWALITLVLIGLLILGFIPRKD
jgi:hypothetical protein